MRMQWIPGLPSPSPLEGLGTRLAQHIQGHCMLTLIQPNESVQISGLEVLQPEEGWIFTYNESL